MVQIFLGLDVSSEPYSYFAVFHEWQMKIKNQPTTKILIHKNNQNIHMHF